MAIDDIIDRLNAIIAANPAREAEIHRFVVRQLFPLALRAAGLKGRIRMLTYPEPDIAGLKHLINEVRLSLLRGDHWHPPVEELFRRRYDLGYESYDSPRLPETLGSVLEVIAVAVAHGGDRMAANALDEGLERLLVAEG